jgi:hypothetical protein
VQTFAFVQFEQQESANTALTLTGMQVFCAINHEYSNDKTKTPAIFNNNIMPH